MTRKELDAMSTNVMKKQVKRMVKSYKARPRQLDWSRTDTTAMNKMLRELYRRGAITPYQDQYRPVRSLHG